jgi:NAD(P)-dependent dehydrogenase (short-subunit alcohol dehydrogenase family)
MQSVDGEPLPYPEKATLLGPVKVIPRELRGIICKSIDVQVPLTTPGKGRRKPAVDIAPVVVGLWTELTAKPENGVVALRGNRRLQADYEPAKTPADDAIAARLRPRGVYLVTGGLGGIGLAMAEHLARNYQARLILTGRTPLPSPERWDAWLAEHSDRDPTSRKIRSLRQLESHGAEVVALAADVANVGDMQHVLKAARERFGPIHGVIHAAGAMDDGLIQLKTAESVEGVFTPKVHGTLLLSRLLADEPLEFFVLFSSSSTALGPAGQVDYTAANCFLNAFAESRRGKKPHTVAVNWGVW